MRYDVTLTHFVCADCSREWWLNAKQRAAYLNDRPAGAADCPYCSLRVGAAYSVDVAPELDEMRV